MTMGTIDRGRMEGRRCMTPSILPEDFTPNGVQQLKLFDDGQPRANSAQLMKLLNSINPGCGTGGLPIRVWIISGK